MIVVVINQYTYSLVDTNLDSWKITISWRKPCETIYSLTIQTNSGLMVDYRLTAVVVSSQSGQLSPFPSFQLSIVAVLRAVKVRAPKGCEK